MLLELSDHKGWQRFFEILKPGYAAHGVWKGG